MANTNPVPYERRAYSRHRALTRVKIRTKGKTLFTNVINLSASGALLKTDGLLLKKNENVQLTFIIKFGNVYKMHKRAGKVVHITGGNTGFFLESFKI